MFVYILHSEPFDKYYIGQTNDMAQRLLRHNSKQVKSTAPYTPWDTVLSIEKETRSEALVLERKIKNLNRERLLQFIKKYS